jgi:hypothetical protein
LERLRLEQSDQQIAKQGKRDDSRYPIEGDHGGLLNSLAQPDEGERGREQCKGEEDVDGVHGRDSGLKETVVLGRSRRR